jgi:hypothetical protein
MAGADPLFTEVSDGHHRKAYAETDFCTTFDNVMDEPPTDV